MVLTSSPFVVYDVCFDGINESRILYSCYQILIKKQNGLNEFLLCFPGFVNTQEPLKGMSITLQKL